MREVTVAVVGATGAVGQQLLRILEERRFPVQKLVAIASERSKGKSLSFSGRQISCEVLAKGIFEGVDIAFFDVDDPLSREWVPIAAQEGAWVIDSSATFRMDERYPFIVPEVNGDLLRGHLFKGKDPDARIITGPNCSTIQLVVPLKVIDQSWGLKRVIVSTYQSTSGAGARASEALINETRATLEGSSVDKPFFQKPIAFNSIPQIGGFDAEGASSEEAKIRRETRKLLEKPDLPVHAFSVRVPTLSCHGEFVYVETKEEATLEDFSLRLSQAAGMEVAQGSEYTTGVEAAGRDPIYLSRIRKDPDVDRCFSFWIVADNLRKGAALNACQIAEMIVE